MGIWFPEYSLTVVDMGGGPGREGDVQPSVVSARADMPGNACCSVDQPLCAQACRVESVPLAVGGAYSRSALRYSWLLEDPTQTHRVFIV